MIGIKRFIWSVITWNKSQMKGDNRSDLCCTGLDALFNDPDRCQGWDPDLDLSCGHTSTACLLARYWDISFHTEPTTDLAHHPTTELY